MTRPRRRRVLIVLAAMLLAGAIALAAVFVPFLVRVRQFQAQPDAGFHADFYVYVSRGAARAAGDGRIVTILVQPNNSAVNSDDPAVHRDDAWWTTFGRRSVADELNVVLLVPAFVRPGKDWHIYTHALDRDVFTTDRADLKRLDLQLIAMIDHARAALEGEGIRADERVLIQGFSASGMFANRFTALHPTRVKAAAIGAPGGWPIVPQLQVDGKNLPYPAGVFDLESLSGKAFDADAFARVPQLFLMGSLDENDSLDFRDGWDEAAAKQVDRLFGDTPIARWKPAEALYRAAGTDARFLLVDGVGHERRKLQKYSTEFFREVLNPK